MSSFGASVVFGALRRAVSLATTMMKLMLDDDNDNDDNYVGVGLFDIGGGVELPTGSGLLLSDPGRWHCWRRRRLFYSNAVAAAFVVVVFIVAVARPLSSGCICVMALSFACIGGLWPQRVYGAGIRWEYIGAPGRIILVNLSQGAALTILTVEVPPPNHLGRCLLAPPVSNDGVLAHCNSFRSDGEGIIF